MVKFVPWLIKNYKNNDCSIGDLTRDIIEDRETNNIIIDCYRPMKKRIESFDLVSSNCLNALDKSYAEYKQIHKK